MPGGLEMARFNNDHDGSARALDGVPLAGPEHQSQAAAGLP